MDILAVADEGDHAEHENPPQGVKPDRVFLGLLGNVDVSQIDQEEEQGHSDIPMDNGQVNQDDDEQETDNMHKLYVLRFSAKKPTLFDRLCQIAIFLEEFYDLVEVATTGAIGFACPIT